ncbi:hypothetical protein L6241_04650 [Janibacter sp. Y6]|uniref:hypothetical protein n=1 Tax=Janibacter sp. Y6 TaxID=2913552 RepID=UPI0034A5956B
MSTSMDGGVPEGSRARRADEHGLTRRHDPRAGEGGRDRHAETGAADLRERQERAYGGMKIGAAFFGWLTAVGLTVLLAAVVAATGTAIGMSTKTSVDEAVADASGDPQAVGIAGVVATLLILLVSYFAGGYVAGRMSRFDGARQGVAVWLWAVVVAVLAAVLGLVAGDRFDALAQLDALPRIPVGTGDAVTTGVIALVVVAVVTLVGAVLGGRAGMRYHRKIDDTALDDIALDD